MGHCEKPAERTRRSRWKLGKTRYDAQRRPKLRRDPAIAAVNLSRVAIIFAPLGDRTKNVSSANEKGRNAPRHNPNEKNENENVAMASVISPQLGAPPARGWGWGGNGCHGDRYTAVAFVSFLVPRVVEFLGADFQRTRAPLSANCTFHCFFFSSRGPTWSFARRNR